jgi:sulfoxide reductase heme-binding subunit YedZ
MPKSAKKRWTLARLLNLATVVGGWIPLVVLVIAYFTDKLGFNPVETVTRRTGRIAVLFLLLSLACTPIGKLFKLPSIRRLRKPLGLFAALYAVLHFLTFAVWDYQLNLTLIWSTIIEKPFIILGAVALVIIVVLAATSFRKIQQKWGKKWVWLHRAVYLAAVMVILHYLLAIKGDLLTLQGNYVLPLIAAGALLFLFLLRILVIMR